jgi:hypothetical protein
MNLKLSNYALDTFLAPKLSQLGKPELQPLGAASASAETWVRAFALETMMRVRPDAINRQYIFNFLRRAEAGCIEYEEARCSLVEYTTGGDRNAVSKYFRALRHFESCLSSTYQAFMVGRELLGKNRLFKKGDGSTLDRLNRLYNRAKHSEKAIASGQIPPEGTVPVWIRNDALECTDGSIRFSELRDLLLELCRCADVLSRPGNVLKDPACTHS